MIDTISPKMYTYANTPITCNTISFSVVAHLVLARS